MDKNYRPRPDLSSELAQELLVSSTYRNPSVLPFRVATIMKNASGLQLTYRGSSVLPTGSPKKSLTKAHSAKFINTVNMTRPKALSIQETQKVKLLARENILFMNRLVNANKSVNFRQYENEYKRHQKLVKQIERMNDQVRPVLPIPIK